MSAPRRLLLIDDDALFLGVASDVLRSSGFEVRAIREATRAVPEARSFDPHLVLVDRVMPVLSGSEVLRSLRAFPETAGIPVAFVTSDRSEREVLRAIRAGAVDVMFKPFDKEHARRVTALLEELARTPPLGTASAEERALRSFLAFYARSRRTGALVVNPGTPFEGRAQFDNGALVNAEFGPMNGEAALREMMQAEDELWRFEDAASAKPRPPQAPPSYGTPPPAPSELFRPRLLIVDDDPELRRLFKMQLTKAGFDVVLADDGAHGVELSTRSLYDLVVADLNMPRLDGWGMLKVFKADHRTREIPLIFLSAHDDYRETLRAARAGASDYLPKMGRSDTVVQRVISLLAPRFELLRLLNDGGDAPVDANRMGVQWVLRALARLKATGELELTDDWATYSMRLRGGAPVDALARWPKREATGVAAVAALLVSRNAEGRFRFTSVPADEGRIHLGMETLIQRTCDTLNQLEARVTASKLNTTGRFDVDAALYELYRHVAPERGLRLARAVCEERLSAAELPLRLHVKPEEVQEGLKELLRRGVIRFPDPG